MQSTEKVERVARHQWVTMPPSDPDPQVVEQCTKHAISAAVADLEGVSIESVTINRTGQFHTPPSVFGFPVYVEENLPDYCEVLVHQASPGGHIAEVRVWVPLVWNGRFLGTGGGGNRTTFGFIPGDDVRNTTLPNAVRNGFAAAGTDGGVGGDPRLWDWQLIEETGELDGELIENWIHRSTHEMTLIGKAVTTAIHGTTPRFSYFQGSSGGGRQALTQVQRYPNDYDGVWAADPAINWPRFIPAELWPALVMKELDNALAPAKLEAFRTAAVEDFNQRNGTSEPFITSVEPPTFDAKRLVGQSTSAGDITETDAAVMNMIWEGPKTPSGEQLWFGLRPGAETWGEMMPGVGLCVTVEDDNGQRKPDPFLGALAWFGTWMLRDPQWDWTTLTFEEFARLFKKGVEEFADTAIDDPDLIGLRDGGAKLLLTHGADDQVIFSQGTVHYFDRVLDHMGGVAGTSNFARFFLCPGDGHSFRLEQNFGLDLATGMVALMNWVENDIAPESLDLLHYAEDKIAIDGTRQVDAYALHPSK
ncbi:tannase/feruloyl esterase family alpha/beta hydrolase [Nocardia vinacea]|uniref:tannase/feruloyl esterase family alpha/beta hydrolase n=1 Tax=Nocardia vinacea TaxID=96468 RepID=UPI0012F6F36C|nr:tannase/feruloyl esterase family alpha/beta hydrolase [Nocardia vinacea]